jgi:4-amino-4-deoxy-L-arabinose transferase-like glycosyltransferase
MKMTTLAHEEDNSIRRLGWGLLLFILLLAAVLRFWRLEQMPPGLYHDEAYNGLDALSLVQGQTFPQFYEGWELYQYDAHAERPSQETRWPVFFEGNYGREPVHIYLMALSIKLFGPTPWAIRAVPALFGVLAVLTTFAAARVLLGRGGWVTPLVAAFVVAVLFPAIHFSRFGLRVMLFVPVATLTVATFWLALNAILRNSQSPRRNFLWFVLSGLLLGVGLYIYAAARLFPLLFVAFALVLLVVQRPLLRQIWPGLVLMAGAAFLTALPLLIFFWRYPYFFFFRIAYVANRGKGTVEGQPLLTWLLNVWRVVGGLFWLGETHLRHNLPGRPYMDAVQAFFFVAGLVRAAAGVWRKQIGQSPAAIRFIFLFLWLVVMLLPSIMSGDAPHFGRMTGAIPVLALFIGLGVDSVARWLLARWSRPALVYGGLAAVLLFSAAWSVYDYFGRYASHPQLAADFYLPEWEMGQVAAAMPPDAAIYLAPTQEELATLYFALADPQRLQNVAGGAIPLGQPGAEALYLLRPTATDFLQQLQDAFPNGRTGAASPTYIPFTVPAAAPRNLAQNAISHSFADQIELAGWTVSEENGALAVTLVWQALAPMNTDYTAFVHLLGADGVPVTQADRQPTGHPTSNWRAGEWVMERFVLPLPPDLTAGDYTLATGFYELATLERLGDTAVLSDWRMQRGD